MPTSITVAPGLIQSPLTISGRPTAATTISARRTTLGRSRVRECAIVTVQLSASSSCAIGLPTMFERPITTASRPDRSPSRSLSSIRQPSGVHGTKPCRPVASRPALTGWKPSTSLSGSIRGDHDLLVDMLRAAAAGRGCRRPSTSALSRSTSASSSASGDVGGQPVLEALHARLDGRLALGADIDRGRRILADQHDREAGRAAGRLAKRRQPAPRSARASPAAKALPSMMSALMALPHNG